METKLDLSRSYGTVWGHPGARYEQGGVLYGADGEPLMSAAPAPAVQHFVPPASKPAAPEINPDEVIQTNAVESAKMFLTTVLAEKTLAKADIWAEAEKSNQSWDAVKKAATLLGIESIVKSPGPGKPKQECWLMPKASQE